MTAADVGLSVLVTSAVALDEGELPVVDGVVVTGTWHCSPW